LERYF